MWEKFSKGMGWSWESSEDYLSVDRYAVNSCMKSISVKLPKAPQIKQKHRSTKRAAKRQRDWPPALCTLSNPTADGKLTLQKLHDVCTVKLSWKIERRPLRCVETKTLHHLFEHEYFGTTQEGAAAYRGAVSVWKGEEEAHSSLL
jgi:hypothetical protein